jgi:acetylornithine aminotransferase
MKPFDVYPLFNITPVRALGSTIYDESGTSYLDLYGGHAVISIGHSHPNFVTAIKAQLDAISFYSNSVRIPVQQRVAEKLGRLSGYSDYNLFFCNSGAEANENAFKLASFHTGRKKILAFKHSFHGRTSAAVAATDDASIVSPLNETTNIQFCEWNNVEQLKALVATNAFAAVIIEGIQGVAGVHIPSGRMMAAIEKSCKETGTLFICDEIQSGYGRTGKFFAHQFANVCPDLITVAKGMGNGFPVAGVLIHPSIEARLGILGTTFGGAHLACAAAESVLDVLENESLIKRAEHLGRYLTDRLTVIPGIKEIRGCGLMIGIELDVPVAEVRKQLLLESHIFTGASGKYTLRILPALTITEKDLDVFLTAFFKIMSKKLDAVSIQVS